MKIIYALTFLLSLLLFSCQSEPSMQQYFVDNQQKKGFSVFDVPSSIINTDKATLTPEQKRVLGTFKKLNVLFYKADPKNPKAMDVQRKQVQSILKDTTHYQQLMKFGSGKEGGSISFVGSDDAVDEIILYGSKSDGGLAVIRILGDHMNPADAMTFLSVLQSSDVNMQQLEPLKGILKP
ncbi:MAG: hypothetical protein RL607_2406 [Bacteroidota bacterium]